MEKEQLFYYKMSEKEKNQWEKLKIDVISTIDPVKTGNYEHFKTENFIDNCLRQRNYGLNPEGFFLIGNYDRNILTLEFEKYSYEQARVYFITEIIFYMCCSFHTTNAAEIKHAHVLEWRYYEVEDKRDSYRVYSHLEKNATYLYDAKYDYRKYWFEDELRMLKPLLSPEDFQDLVTEKENNMNTNSVGWVYDVTKQEFIMNK